jgi:predicted dehydrogenase
MARLDELQAAVDQNHNKVLVGFQFRFHPGLQCIKKLIKKKAIGEVLSVHAHWGEYLPNWHPWEDYKQGYAARPELGGGVILTLSHPLDYLRWFFGEVEAISAFTSQRGLKLPVEDTAEIFIRFKNSAMGTIHLDYLQRPASHELEIIGSKGTIRWGNSDGIVKLAQVGQNGKVSDWQDFPPPADFERNTMFLDEMRHFLEVIKGQAKPVCTLHDGVMALNLALSALASSQQCQVITINDHLHE